MSAAPLLRRVEPNEYTEEENTVIHMKMIPITPNVIYQSIFRESVAANANVGLETTIPLSEEEYLQFFAQAIAKEIKAIGASSGVPAFLEGRAKELKQTTPDTLETLFGKTPSASPHYKNLSLNARRPGKPQPPFIASALIVLEESIRSLVSGSPLTAGPLKDIPTTLFLYYRTPDGIIPVYSGHIFVQAIDSWLFFVSIYKSLFEDEKGLSDRILDDVIAYAKAKGFAGVFTSPLESMKSTLVRRGILPDATSKTYVMRFPEAARVATNGAGTTQGGGMLRLTRRRNPHRRRRQKRCSCRRIRSRCH